MKPWAKRGLAFLAIVLIGAIVIAGWYLGRAIPIGTGYVAKYVCSSVFISGRDDKTVFEEDVSPVNPLTGIISYKVDRKGKAVTADTFGLFESRAIYREGCGCTLVVGIREEDLIKQPIARAGSGKRLPPDRAWPAGNRESLEPLPPGVDAGKLTKAVDAAFVEASREKLRKTRAVLVVYDGRLIAERYAPGFDRNMPLLGWSMGKSVTNALVGILVRKGKLKLQDPAPVQEWRKQGDPRRRITLADLMRMSSGLEFDEVYEPLHDVTNMLYSSADFAAYAASKPLEAEPGAKWNYSSGTANIISRIIRRAVEKDYPNYYTFLRQELFDKIGMTSAVMEPDPSGTFVGSSYTFATPRDWARFGLLYLDDGVWQGERILPEGWVKYTTTPAPAAPNGEYGALFWLNAGSGSAPGNRMWPSIPQDAYAAKGYQEQAVIIIPSRKLVLVRFGATSVSRAWDSEAFIADVLRALPS
jgi:CubicO group peptidase (beta-lactamase class C family)